MTPPGTESLGESESGNLADGGTLTTSLGSVKAPQGAALTDLWIEMIPVEVPGGLPEGFSSVGNGTNIILDKPDMLNAPLIVELPYDDSSVSDEDDLLVLHYDAVRGFEPVTLLEHDSVANKISFDTRTFSTFVVVEFVLDALLPASHSVSGFSPNTKGWNINNFGNYFYSGGNCLGMSAYCAWFFQGRASENLNGKFSSSGGSAYSIAHLVAARAHLAQSQYWANKSHQYAQLLGDERVARKMRIQLALFNRPLILVMTRPGAGHACVLYGYDANGFTFYDVNARNQSQSLPYSASSFGTYNAYTTFSYVGLPSLGRTEDFEALTTQGEGGFTSSQYVTCTSPTEGQQVNAREVQLQGSISSSLNSAVELHAVVKGIQQIIPLTNRNFDATIPVAYGSNTLILLAGLNIRSQSNWYRNAATLVRSFDGTLPATDLLCTLTWDQNLSDVDLYVTEPGGGTAWYSDPTTSSQLWLDFDNTSGYGPEHTTLSSDAGGTVQSGNYTVRVHYYADHGGGAVTGEVTVVLGEKTGSPQLRTIPFSISTANSGNYTPGSSGLDWVDIAVVDVQNAVFITPP